MFVYRIAAIFEVLTKRYYNFAYLPGQYERVTCHYISPHEFLVQQKSRCDQVTEKNSRSFNITNQVYN